MVCNRNRGPKGDLISPHLTCAPVKNCCSLCFRNWVWLILLSTHDLYHVAALERELRKQLQWSRKKQDYDKVLHVHPYRFVSYPDNPLKYLLLFYIYGASRVALMLRNLPANARGVGLISGCRKSPGGGYGNPVQYSYLEPMDRGSWWATVHRVAQSQTRLNWLSTHAFYIYRTGAQKGGLVQGLKLVSDRVRI